ncbi:cytochrome P450 [Roridomyces roridus]|uniref:Cytochrome P450 n=1 Tax=Roridomyces roridus TaxID=1738132 RepID=A0AAD7B378_9AGAR|nr:cytochrome P450 [Roridomyces roridus]
MLYLILFIALSSPAAIYFRKVGSRESDLPPGPPTLPIIGNLHLFPTKSPHFKFTEWARIYGGIYSLKIGPGTVIVLTDPNAVKELLEKKSGSTSDRPAIYIVELVTRGLHVALARYGDTWRTLRKTAHSILTAQAAERHLPIQQAEAAQLLYDILCTPKGFFTHGRRYSSSIIMSVLYGKRAPRYETPETTLFFRMWHEWTALLEPGATPPIDLIPLLRFFPPWPTKWKRAATRIRAWQRDLYFRFLGQTEDRLRRGEPNGSYMEEVVRKQKEFGLDRETAAYFAGALIEGGSDTTSAYLNSFILCMVAHPTFRRERRKKLTELKLQIHRFRPVAPLLFPHAATKSERYLNYMIPNGSTIFVNSWGIFHDPDLYEDPESFLPERFLLTENGTKPGLETSSLKPTLSFGVGRRACAGIHVAQNSINISVMNLLWAFDFKPPVDLEGNVIEPDLWGQGITTDPLPFECQITPRTREKAELIRQEFFDATDVFEKFEFGLSSEDREFVAQSRRRSSM